MVLRYLLVECHTFEPKYPPQHSHTSLTNYYNNVMEDAEAPTLDLGELRNEIGSIKGVGEKRLDEIMAVIERHLGV